MDEEQGLARETEEAVTAAADALGAASEGLTLWHRLGLAALVMAGSALLILLVWALFRKLAWKTAEWGKGRLKPLIIKKLHLLSEQQILGVILFSLRILKYVVTVFVLVLTVPFLFKLFPATEHIANTLFGYILTPVKNIFFGAVHYIPNLFTIVIILIVNRYVLKALKFFAAKIAAGKLVISGFYEDWAQPTFNILRILVYAFTVAMVYPYLPGSNSQIFQGVSVLLGIIFSLGSSTAIGNLVAGLVITYMRPFKIGDRIQIQNTIGFVVEKSPIVVRIKTHKNEYITFPNMIILSSSIINYNTSSDEDGDGLILHADITFGYNTPWQVVHEVLIEAALATEYVQKTPRPFVLQTALDDFYCRYQINLYTKAVDKTPAIYSLLYENIQNGFHAKGLDMTAAHYLIDMPPGPAPKTP
jgi:small-conductance mechanosensitive channel